MDLELKTFRDLLLWLFHTHTKPWDYEDEAQEIYSDIGQGYATIGTLEELEYLLPTESKASSSLGNRYLYLPPLRDGPVLVPLVWVTCDFCCSIPRLKLALGIFLRHEEKTRGFAYRFESPEGPGLHHYYHVQILRSFGDDPAFMEESRWLPTSCPAFPIDAISPVQLLLSVLITLYGLPIVIELKIAVDGIEKHLAQMHCPRFPPFEWYWMTIPPDERKDVKKYITTSDAPAVFRDEFVRQFAKWDIVGITRGSYDEQDIKFEWRDKTLIKRKPLKKR